MLANLHAHTSYTDGKSTVAEMAAAAFNAGFKVFGFSEHSYTPDMPGFPGLTPENFSAYKKDVLQAREMYTGKMDIFFGIEQDMLTGCVAEGFDYSIGSVHAFPKNGRLVVIDESADIQKKDIAELYSGDAYAYIRDYFEYESRIISVTGADIIGHIDLVCKFNEREYLFSENDPRYIDAAFAAVDELIKSDVIFEINTGAMSRGYRTSPYPSSNILKRIRECGGRVTISSDCHSVDSVAFAFSEASELAALCGFKELWTLGENGFFTVPLSI